MGPERDIAKIAEDCIKDLETLGIKISHMIKHNITLDWHTSEVRNFSIRFSLHLFIGSDTPKPFSH
jgi:hypothetical protein